MTGSIYLNKQGAAYQLIGAKREARGKGLVVIELLDPSGLLVGVPFESFMENFTMDNKQETA